MLSRPEAITLDMDGTIVEVSRRRWRLWPQVLRHPKVLLAYPSTIESLRQKRHPDLPSAICDQIAAKAGVPPQIVEDVLDGALGDHWIRLFQDQRPMPRVGALLGRALRAGVPIGLVSDHPVLPKRMAMQGLGQISVAVSCTQLGALKPFPDGIIAAMAQLGTRNVVHIGDRWDTDGGAAAAAGIPFLHIDDAAVDLLLE